ncbi:unnamed protein product [Trichobilharzia szidati]|nr:unnamed protein product [Trichobilharzia szidati]
MTELNNEDSLIHTSYPPSRIFNAYATQSLLESCIPFLCIHISVSLMNNKKVKDVDIIPKSDIRQLIKVAKPQTQRTIDHPHARYNQLGRISCILCGVQIKSEFAWTAHILSKSHKQNELRGVQPLTKRPAVENNPDDVKSSKLTKVDESVQNKSDVKIIKEAHNSKSSTIVSKDAVVEKNPTEKKVESKSQLPEGFFDDRYKDAKVRCVPYKDKMTEELELFQKEMNVLEKHSEEIMEKESEALVSERNLAEINEQLVKWEKIKQLEQAKDLYEMRLKEKLSDRNINQLKNKLENHIVNVIKKEDYYTTTKEDNNADDNTEDEDDGDEDISNELNDFRTKNTI